MNLLTRTRSGPHVVNEDRILCDPELGLYAVLDGECNEGLAADVAIRSLREHRHDLLEAAQLGAEAARDALARAVEAAASLAEFQRCRPSEWIA